MQIQFLFDLFLFLVMTVSFGLGWLCAGWSLNRQLKSIVTAVMLELIARGFVFYRKPEPDAVRSVRKVN